MVIVKYKYFRKSFSASGSSNLGFYYSHLEKQDKESLTEVVTKEWTVRLEITNQKNHSGSRSAGVHRRGPADFFLKCTKNNYFLKPNNSTRNMLKLLQWKMEFSLYFILFCYQSIRKYLSVHVFFSIYAVCVWVYVDAWR
jgi:hypothetical protein